MQFFAAGSDYTTKMEAFVQGRQSRAFGTFVCFVRADKRFDLLGEKSTHGGGPASGEYFGFANCICAQTDGHILFFVRYILGHGFGPFHVWHVLHLLYVDHADRGTDSALSGYGDYANGMSPGARYLDLRSDLR
jgi:hypothetical protein